MSRRGAPTYSVDGCSSSVTVLSSFPDVSNVLFLSVFAARIVRELQQAVGSNAEVCVKAGSVKDALLEAARESDADVLMIGRGSGGDSWADQGSDIRNCSRLAISRTQRLTPQRDTCLSAGCI